MENLIADIVVQNVAIYDERRYVTIVKTDRVDIEYYDLETSLAGGRATRFFQLFRVREMESNQQVCTIKCDAFDWSSMPPSDNASTPYFTTFHEVAGARPCLSGRRLQY